MHSYLFDNKRHSLKDGITTLAYGNSVGGEMKFTPSAERQQTTKMR